MLYYPAWGFHNQICRVVYLFMHPLGKLLVTTGYPYENGQKSEIIDLPNPGSVCEDLPDFPIQVGAASGGLLLNNQPLICGGLSSNYELQCYIVGNGHFKQIQTKMKFKTIMQWRSFPCVSSYIRCCARVMCRTYILLQVQDS